MRNKLNACPWCGEEPILNERDKLYYIVCTNDQCIIKPISQYELSKIDLISSWNSWGEKVTQNA